MRHVLNIPGTVQRKIKKIDARHRVKLLIALTILAKDPYIGKRLVGKYRDQWSHQLSVYTIVYRILNKKLLLLAVQVKKK